MPAGDWSIPDEHLEEARNAFDGVLSNWGKPCRLIYPGKKISCTNCATGGHLGGGGGQASSHYRHGGPIPFSAGSACPLCNASGKVVQEVSETLTFRVTFDPREFKRIIPTLDIRMPYSFAQIKGMLSDWPKVQRAERIILQHPIEAYSKLTFKLAGEALDLHDIIQGRYFFALLERTQ